MYDVYRLIFGYCDKSTRNNLSRTTKLFNDIFYEFVTVDQHNEREFFRVCTCDNVKLFKRFNFKISFPDLYNIIIHSPNVTEYLIEQTYDVYNYKHNYCYYYNEVIMIASLDVLRYLSKLNSS